MIAIIGFKKTVSGIISVNQKYLIHGISLLHPRILACRSRWRVRSPISGREKTKAEQCSHETQLRRITLVRVVTALLLGFSISFSAHAEIQHPAKYKWDLDADPLWVAMSNCRGWIYLKELQEKEEFENEIGYPGGEHHWDVEKVCEPDYYLGDYGLSLTMFNYSIWWSDDPEGAPAVEHYPGTVNLFFVVEEDELLNSGKNIKSDICIPTCVGNPISIDSFNKIEAENDYVDGRAYKLNFIRYYNSSIVAQVSATSANIGNGWSHSFSRDIRILPSGDIKVALIRRDDGSYYAFKQNGSSWAADSDVPFTLKQIVNGLESSWEIEDHSNGSVEIYDSLGKLIRIDFRDGDELNLEYDATGKLFSVSDRQSRKLRFFYDESGSMTSFMDPMQNLYEYIYDSSSNLLGLNLLVEVRYPGFHGKRYNYYVNDIYADKYGLLKSIVDENNETYAVFDYDNYGLATSTQHADGVDKYTLLPSGLKTYVTDSYNLLYEYTFSIINGSKRLVQSIRDCSQPCSWKLSYTYDSNGLLDIHKDYADNIIDYDFNNFGLLVQKKEAVADTAGGMRTTQTDWHAGFRVPSERRIYDASNTLVAESSWSYSARGQVLDKTQIDPAANTSRTTAVSYCEQADIDVGTCPFLGLVMSIDGPRTDNNDVASYVYRMADEASCVSAPATCPYRKGDLWKVSNALGHVTETLAYDGAGRVLSVKDRNGVITDLEYHPRGWLTARKVRGTDDSVETDDQITRIEYWPTGLVKKVMQPGGAFTAYTYDAAHRLIDISDNAGNTIHYTLDNAGNQVQEDTKDAGGVLTRTLSRVYNQLGQLATQADATANPTDFTYDANGSLDTVTDAYGRVTDNDYDPLNRLVRTLQDVGGIAAEIKFEYDALDHLTKVTDPKGLATTYTYNGFGDLTQLFSPDTRTTTYTYDSAGNRASATDPSGRRTDYSYDALNRLTGIDYPYASQDVSFVYDVIPSVCGAGETYAIGRLSTMADNSGSTAYCYDRFGHLVRKVQTTSGQAFTVRYAYTKAGQVQSIVYPDGAVVDYVRDAQGRVTEVGVTAVGDVRRVLVNQVAWYPFGPAAGWVYGNGRSLERTYNLNYQPETVLDGNPGGLSLGYSFGVVGNLTQLSDGFQSTLLARYDYDALGRLSATRDGPTGTVIETYGYDATGNRTSLTNAGGTTAYVYDADKHRLREVGGATRWYDISGNTLSIGGSAREFAYNVTGRMKLAQRNNVTVMQYAYNGKGERVRRYLGATSTYTVYDEAGRWLGDYDSSGVPIQQAIWLDSLPVGLLAGAGSSQQLHYVEPDHLGTPRVVIDPVRDVVVWAWDIKGEAFGNTIPDQDPDSDGTVFVFDMRFPGQRYDAASGLNYNYLRDYEPTSGRYVQSDPIGLRGGISTYSYVSSSPLLLVDPLGLKARICCRTIPGLPASHCFVQEVADKDKQENCSGSNCTSKTRRVGLQGPTPWGSSKFPNAGEVHINDPFDDPAQSDCGEWNTDCGVSKCIDGIVNGYANPSVYNAIRGPNSNTFAGTVSRQCNLTRPVWPWAPGWGDYPAPPAKE